MLINGEMSSWGSGKWERERRKGEERVEESERERVDSEEERELNDREEWERRDGSRERGKGPRRG